MLGLETNGDKKGNQLKESDLIRINVRQLRESRGLSTTQFADIVGTDPQTISGIETGQKGCGTDLRERMVRAFGIPFDYFFKVHIRDVQKFPDFIQRLDIDHLTILNWEELVEIVKQLKKEEGMPFGDKPYGIKFNTDMLQPIIMRNEILVIDPKEYPKSGDIVVALVSFDAPETIKGEIEESIGMQGIRLLLRRVLFKGKNHVLRSLNMYHSDIIVSQTNTKYIRYLGKAIEKRQPL